MSRYIKSKSCMHDDNLPASYLSNMSGQRSIHGHRYDSQSSSAMTSSRGMAILDLQHSHCSHYTASVVGVLLFCFSTYTYCTLGWAINTSCVFKSGSFVIGVLGWVWAGSGWVHVIVIPVAASVASIEISRHLPHSVGFYAGLAGRILQT